MCLARDYAVMACASMSGFAPLLRWLIPITRCLALRVAVALGVGLQGFCRHRVWKAAGVTERAGGR
jgi:hypothetical protein